MKYVQTNKAPSAIGPYSQAVVVGNMVYTSGQIALTCDGIMLASDIKLQTKQVISNLRAVLQEAGSDLSKVVKTTIFLSDMDNFSTVNNIYEKAFGNHKPVRSTVAVKTLPKEALVEIDAVAIIID